MVRYIVCKCHRGIFDEALHLSDIHTFSEMMKKLLLETCGCGTVLNVTFSFPFSPERGLAVSIYS